MSVWETGEALTKDEASELRRLNGKHRDIRLNGAEALQAQKIKDALQERRQAFVSKHGISCFKCSATMAQWAAGGPRANGGFWVICTTCVRKPR